MSRVSDHVISLESHNFVSKRFGSPDGAIEMASGGEVEPAVNLDKAQSDIGERLPLCRVRVA